MSRPSLAAVLRHAIAASGPDAAPDADLLKRFAADRDGAAFAALVARHGPMVWGVCRNLLSHDPDAEDAFQATFLALVRAAGTVRDGAVLAGWLHGVAVRVSLKARRAAAHRRKRERAAAGPEAAAAVPEGEWEELLAAVHAEVGRLPAALREALVLCGLEGVRQQDAAARLGCKPGTLTARLTRARQRLLANLARRGLTPAAGVVAFASPAVPAAVAARAAELARSVEPISPSVLYLAQGVIAVNTRTKWLAASLLAAVGLAMSVGTALVSPASAQLPNDPNDPQPRPTVAKDEPNPRYSPAGRPTPAPAPATRGWEYKVVGQAGVNRTPSEASLNRLGDEGWELSAVLEGNTLVFKRPKAAGVTSPAATPANRNPFLGESVAPRPKVFALKRADATDTARVLKELFARTPNVQVTVDARTNSLVVAADDETLKVIEALVERVGAADPVTPPTPRPR